MFVLIRKQHIDFEKHIRIFLNYIGERDMFSMKS